MQIRKTAPGECEITVLNPETKTGLSFKISNLPPDSIVSGGCIWIENIPGMPEWELKIPTPFFLKKVLV